MAKVFSIFLFFSMIISFITQAEELTFFNSLNNKEYQKNLIALNQNKKNKKEVILDYSFSTPEPENKPVFKKELKKIPPAREQCYLQTVRPLDQFKSTDLEKSNVKVLKDANWKLVETAGLLWMKLSGGDVPPPFASVLRFEVSRQDKIMNIDFVCHPNLSASEAAQSLQQLGITLELTETTQKEKSKKKSDEKENQSSRGVASEKKKAKTETL